ncbi:MAG: hypothetical protein AAB255_00035 [Bacteroidota bacterium]
MTTNAPSTIKFFDDASLEKIAYKSVSSIPTREPNDQVRLGYSIWKFLSEKKGTLEEAIANAQSHALIDAKNIAKIIRENLKLQGIKV